MLKRFNRRVARFDGRIPCPKVCPLRCWDDRLERGETGQIAPGVQAVESERLQRIEHPLALGRRNRLIDIGENVPLTALQVGERLPPRRQPDVHDPAVVRAAETRQVAVPLQITRFAALVSDMAREVMRRRCDIFLGPSLRPFGEVTVFLPRM